MTPPRPGTPPTRRTFLKKSAAAGLGFTFIPAYLTSARAADNPLLPPSRRINLGCIGVGGRASGVVPGLCDKGTAQPIAFADVDYESARNVTKTIAKFPDVPRYHDFRVMLDEQGKDIDAVSVVTPDHTHFVAAIHAMSLGKHVYVEKPLTHTFTEAEMLMRAEKKFGVVTQMGNQGHTSSGAEQFKQMRAAGLVDDVVKVEAWKSPSLWFMDASTRIAGNPPKAEPPASLQSWDLWCGPREMKPFSAMYHPFDWRGFHAYGSGMFGDWGCHIIDFIHHYLELGLPTRITPVHLADHNQISFPLSSEINFKFPKRGRKLPALDLHWKAGGEAQPTVSETYADLDKDGKPVIPNPGKTGSLLHRKKGDYLIQRGHHAGASRLYPRIKMAENRDAMKAPNPQFNHAESFVQACMGNGQTESPFSVGGELTQVLNLGMIAEYLNEELRFNPKKKRFIRNEAANALLEGPTPRPEWAPYYNIV
ncbi:MAG: Gfo/Idh/MocA family oxidoreductase [Synoicihabitans sp.]